MHRSYARSCVCVYVSVLRAYVCTGATGHRDTKGLEAHDRRRSRSHSRSRLHRVAAGVSARGIPDYRARAGRTHHRNAKRNGDEGRWNDFVPPLRAAIFSVLGARLSSPARNAYRALSTLIVLYRLVLVGLRVPGLEIIPLVPLAFEQLRPLRAREISPLNSARGKVRLPRCIESRLKTRVDWSV